MKLALAGLMAAAALCAQAQTPTEFEVASAKGLPAGLVDPNKRWIALNTGVRSAAYNTLLIPSEQAPRICQGALGVCGIAGYKNDTPYSVGRHLRDTLSACLMVANERIHQTNARLLLIAKEV